MAKTKIEVKKYVDNVEKGVTVGTQKPSKPGETMKVYIPKLMPYITKGEASTAKVVTKGNMLFANDPACKPNAPSIVTTQNFITATMMNGSSWNGIIEDESKDMVPSGTSIQATFSSGNIEDVKFSPN